MHRLFVFSLVGCLLSGFASAADLNGVANVNITSDTATNAKNIAFDEARRQIIVDALRSYADKDALQIAVKNAKNADLVDLIAASSIDGEQTSDTTYSASISMTIDGKAARQWLTEQNVQNWLPDGTHRDVFVVNVKLSNAMPQWMDLHRIARNEQIDLGTKNITADSAVLEIPTSARGKFTIALREAGWRYANQDGALRIWK